MSHTCTTTLIVVSEERNRTTEWNVKWPGQYHSRILDRWAANAGRSEGATAVKAVPFLCAARQSLSSRSVHVASCSCLALQLECIVESYSPSYMSASPLRTRKAASAVEDATLSADQVLPACAAFIADRAPRGEASAWLIFFRSFDFEWLFPLVQGDRQLDALSDARCGE